MKARCKESPPGTTDSSFMQRQGKVLLALLTPVSGTGKESHSGTTDSSFKQRQGK